MLMTCPRIVLTVIGTVGTVWASWWFHKAFQQGKVEIVGIVSRIPASKGNQK